LEGAGDPKPGMPVGRAPGDVLAAQADPAAVGFQEAADDIEEGRLAGSIGADQAEPLSFEDVERNPGQGLQAAEGNRHPLHLQQHRVDRGGGLCDLQRRLS